MHIPKFCYFVHLHFILQQLNHFKQQLCRQVLIYAHFCQRLLFSCFLFIFFIFFLLLQLQEPKKLCSPNLPYVSDEETEAQKSQVVECLIFNCKCLYILQASTFSNMYFPSIFYFEGCLFTFLTVFYGALWFISLIKSNLIYFILS